MKFVALFLGTASEVEKAAATAEQSKTLIEDWTQWFGRNAAAIVDGGTPLGRTRQVRASGISEARNAIVAYMIVEADSHDAAARIFADHPHLALMPANAIEVMECLAIPTE